DYYCCSYSTSGFLF
nr:immunoglobulin light chain junction region [Macaca mulatta]